MQIGSGSDPLPGRSLGAQDAPPPLPTEPFSPPDLADEEASRQGRRWRRWGMVLGLLAVVAIAALAGERFTRGMAWRHTLEPPIEAGARRILWKTAHVLHIFRAVVTNDSVSLTPTQLRIATEYSPFRPVSEARRVEELERRRVETSVTGVESRAQGVAASSPVVMSPAPGDVGTGRTVHAAAEKPVVWPPLRVTAIIGDRHSNGYIRVNGRLLTTGDLIDGVVVTAISNSPRSVTLSYGGRLRVFYAGDGK